jgi:hypothetical protein
VLMTAIRVVVNSVSFLRADASCGCCMRLPANALFVR